MNDNSKIGQYELIIKELLNNNDDCLINNIKKNKFDKDNEDKKYDKLSDYQKNKIKHLETHLDKIKDNFVSNEYYNEIMNVYINWINSVRLNLIEKIDENNFYNFFIFDGNSYLFKNMKDYYDVPKTEKLFSFSLFINDTNNLSYLIGLVYNYCIILKHFKGYKMRVYIDFHSVFGSPETFNVFNMFIDILKEIDSTFMNNIQFIVFFLNPFYNVEGESIYNSIVSNLLEVQLYYNNIFYNTEIHYTYSPLLNMSNNCEGNTNNYKVDKNTNNVNEEMDKTKVDVDIENLEINIKNINKTTKKSTFALFSTHLSVNLRFLPLNEDCEFHVRDLDSRLSLTDKNIIKKFNNPKFQYVPYYVFQFYKFYFPYLKWRIDVNPYLAGCFGGDNRKQVMISNTLNQMKTFKILKKEIFFKYILFLSFNCTNLRVGFLNDEFILANIFERIKGEYSENILYLNLGSFANKHVNEYYYSLNRSPNYPCMLKLGIPIDILRYPLNGKYLTIDPITDFKIGIIPLKYHNHFKELMIEQLQKYLGISNKEKSNLSNIIRQNYKIRLETEIKEDLEAALFFSMIPKSFTLNNFEEFDSPLYTSKSYTNDMFSSIGSSTHIVNNINLKATNFLLAGYLLSDILEDIIFPTSPQFINSNYFISSDNYDRLFNCLYFDDYFKKFVQRRICKKDLSKKYIDKSILKKIPKKYLAFEDNKKIVNELSYEFNEYLENSTYYSSMSWYINNLKFNNFLQIENKLIKSGLLLFIKNYSHPIYDKNNNVINDINEHDVKNLKYRYNKKTNNISEVNISKKLLKFNLLLIDDEDINQLTYHNPSNSSKVNIKLISDNNIKNLSKHLNNKNTDDFLIVDKI
jgi:hypothetical protein